MFACKNCSKLLLASLLAATVPALADPLYSLTFLPNDFRGAGINNAGQIVGTAGGGAAIWSAPGALTSFGWLIPGSEGLGINDRGDIVGSYQNQGFVFSGDVFSAIPNRATRGWATSINNGGAVTGTAVLNSFDGPTSGYYYTRDSIGTPTYIDSGFPFASGENSASAINNSNVIVGTVHTNDGTDDDWSDRARQAYTWQGGSLRTWGTLGGSISEGLDINDAGTLAGWSTNAAGDELAFLASDLYGMVDLGSLGGTSTRALGLNNHGWAVGISDVSIGAGFDYHAFLYNEHGIVDLNALIDPLGDWRLVSATDINDAGQILGQACNALTDECRSVRLDLIPAVPEPATWLMLLGGLGLFAPALLRRARRRARFALPLLAAPLAAPLAAAPYPPDPTPAFTMSAVPRGLSAEAINNAGHIVGRYGNAAAVWDGSGISTIVALAPGSYGYGMNDRGDIVGDYNGSAFVKDGAGMRDLGRYGSWRSSYGIGVNMRGDVIGNGNWGPGERGRGWVNSLGVLRVIGAFNGADWSEVRAINRHAQVVGTAQNYTPRSPRDHRGFLYQDRLLQDLGALGDGINSEAWDINDAGQIVGGAEHVYDPLSETPFHPFLYQDRLMRDLGTLGGPYGLAYGINNTGAVVGESSLAEEGPVHAFLYEGGVMRDLDALTAKPPGWVVVMARDINDRRQILARACLAEDCTMVRLDPVASAPKR